jgi:hypothetical protein
MTVFDVFANSDQYPQLPPPRDSSTGADLLATLVAVERDVVAATPGGIRW